MAAENTPELESSEKLVNEKVSELYELQKNIKLQQDLSKYENKRGNLRLKRNKLITKIQNLVNKEETNKIEKKREKIEKYKDDSSRMFTAIKDLNKMKPKTRLLMKERNQFTAN